MRVLVIGTPGVRRDIALSSIFHSAKQLFPQERIYSTESGSIPTLEGILYPSPAQYLERPCLIQRDEWRKAFLSITKKFRESKCRHFILGMHLAYRYNQLPIVPADFRMLAKWRPDCIITLIDDAYCVRERIHAGGYTSFTLAELLLWRAEEIMLGDLLARNIDPKSPPPNYVISVRHPAHQVARLIFSHNKDGLQHPMARVYLSYNIANTRSNEEYRKEINHFRAKFYEQEHCFAFDPLTIDEFPPVIEAARIANRKYEQQHELEYEDATGLIHDYLYDPSSSSNRWPAMDLPEAQSPLADDSDIKSIAPIKIPIQELLDTAGALKAQIKNRDLRLLDQSHFVAVCRPTMHMGDTISGGVLTEIIYAKDTGCPTIFYVKKGVDQLPGSALGPYNPCNDPDYFYQEDEHAFWKRISELHMHKHVLEGNRNHFLR